MKQIGIGNKQVGEGSPVYVIAEAGSNHNGSLDQAISLIDVAVEAGADAVKFQNFKAARMYPKAAGESDYLKVSKSIYDIIKEMEMPDEWLPHLSSYCREKGIEFISSPFDEASADLLTPHLNAFKIASYEMTHAPLLRHVARLGKPLIVSTGTATLAEVVQAVDTIKTEGNEQIILLQCTASYPTPVEAVNARALVTLRETTGELVGLSDHSRDPVIAPTVAVALGACLVEKHFTLSNRLPGPDHKFALEPHELALMINSIRMAEKVLGHGRKEVLPVEEELRSFARRSIFAIETIRAGEALSADNVAVLRCGKLGYELAPDQYQSLLGRRAAREIAAESLIKLGDLA
jgi:N-acetylneuraminate synthase